VEWEKRGGERGVRGEGGECLSFFLFAARLVQLRDGCAVGGVCAGVNLYQISPRRSLCCCVASGSYPRSSLRRDFVNPRSVNDPENPRLRNTIPCRCIPPRRDLAPPLGPT
jgi:hypothetical protein